MIQRRLRWMNERIALNQFVLKKFHIDMPRTWDEKDFKNLFFQHFLPFFKNEKLYLGHIELKESLLIILRFNNYYLSLNFKKEHDKIFCVRRHWQIFRLRLCSHNFKAKVGRRNIISWLIDIKDYIHNFFSLSNLNYISSRASVSEVRRGISEKNEINCDESLWGYYITECQ